VEAAVLPSWGQRVVRTVASLVVQIRVVELLAQGASAGDPAYIKRYTPQPRMAEDEPH
jgi:hypothetical protein